MGYYEALILLTLTNLCQCRLDTCYFNCEELSYDLTHPLNEDTPAYPGLTPEAFIPKPFYQFPEPYILTYNYIISAFAGTCILAPAGFYENNRQVNEIPFTQLTKVEGRVIDIADKVKMNPTYEATVEDIMCNEKEYGCFGPGTVIIIFTGWSSRWPNQERVFGTDSPTVSTEPPTNGYKYPGLSEDAAQYIASQPNIYGVLIDSPGVDAGAVPIAGFDDYTSSKILARENKYIVQNVNIQCTLPNQCLKIYVLPLYVEGGTSAPVRVFAHVCQDQCPAKLVKPLLPPPPPPRSRPFNIKKL